MAIEAGPSSRAPYAVSEMNPDVCPGNAPTYRLDGLRTLWNALVAGRVHVTAGFSTHDRTGIELSDRPPPFHEFRLSPRDGHMIEEALLSQSQKAAAIDLRVSQALVAGALHRSFQKMGFDCTYRTAPPLLVLMVLANRRSVEPRGLVIQTSTRGARIAHTVSVERPDARAGDLLSPAESAVARMMVDGNTHEQMAALRRTSRRTIANQISAIHAKLGAAGRIDLISRLSVCA